MSSVVLTELECDGRPNCFNRLGAGQLEAIHCTRGRVSEARRVARKHFDWDRRKVGHSMYDLCPECKDHPNIEQIIKERVE